MAPETQLLLRNEPQLLGPPTLVVDPPDVAAVTALRREAVSFWVRHHGVARGCPADVEVYRTADWVPAVGPFDQAIVFLPKGRRLQHMTFAQVRAGLGDGARVWVTGANQAGIKGARSALADAVGPVHVVDAARRCTLLAAKAEGPPPPFEAAAWARRWTAEICGRSVMVESWPGTFSDGELDEGTAALLGALLDQALGARILDMASGSGVVGAMLAKDRPKAEVTLVDVAAAAVAASAATIALNGLTNARAFPSDWYSDVTGAFDDIVCNPPFHEGVRTDRRMAASVIAAAPAFLRPGGRLWLVANRFLPYLDALRATFASVDVVRDTNRFRVYRATGAQARRSGSDRRR